MLQQGARIPDRNRMPLLEIYGLPAITSRERHDGTNRRSKFTRRHKAATSITASQETGESHHHHPHSINGFGQLICILSFLSLSYPIPAQSPTKTPSVHRVQFLPSQGARREKEFPRTQISHAPAPAPSSNPKGRRMRELEKETKTYKSFWWGKTEVFPIRRGRAPKSYSLRLPETQSCLCHRRGTRPLHARREKSMRRGPVPRRGTGPLRSPVVSQTSKRNILAPG